MENLEIFTLTVNYKNTSLEAQVKTELPIGPEPLTANYVIAIGQQTFVINPALSQSDVPAWKLISGEADNELMQLVGNAIERHPYKPHLKFVRKQKILYITDKLDLGCLCNVYSI